MSTLKQNLKQILVNKQHMLYAGEVASKNLTYDRWIREQEKKILIADPINLRDKKCLTNDSAFEGFDGVSIQNDGNHSKSVEGIKTLEFTGKNGQLWKKTEYLYAPIDALDGNKIEDFLHYTISDVILLTMYSGEISEIACGLINQCFCENENIILIYGDEDVQEGKVRKEPWFKPDWSPDRFLSCFYFGGLTAVRTSALKETYHACKKQGIIHRWQEENAGNPDTDSRELIYLLFYEMLKGKNGFARRSGQKEMPVYHIRQVLFHGRENGHELIKDLKLPSFAGGEEAAEAAKAAGAAKATGTAKAAETTETTGDAPEDTILSVIIPSKDNPEALFHCLDSFLERTRSDYPFEMILVDNGSREENRKKISDRAAKLNQALADKKGGLRLTGCSYLYQPMEFNFSHMCNLGAGEAKGKLLFFLNDDMEIIQPDWMNLMVQKALLPRAGAVGAKLLYPDSDIIQHAGITNLRVGPAHKLQFLKDDREHYFGMNRGVHNMLGVTGACLMVSKEVFAAAGGFCEDLAVAFNDVDLCYKIFEQGYYNIVRNDVVFYHHESLSRGKDGESSEKQLRLLREKDILYERHQELYGKDPYYHPYLTTDMLESEYSPACRYQVTLDMPWSGAAACEKEVQKAREDGCLVVGMECAMDIYKWQYGVSPGKGKVKIRPEDMGYYFQGYSFVIGADNACYKKKLLLRNQSDGHIWAIAVDNRYRKDIKDNLKDQLNVDLTGFAAKLRREEIPVGIYQFGMLAEDKCSRQKLVNWSNWVLEAGTDGNE